MDEFFSRQQISSRISTRPDPRVDRTHGRLRAIVQYMHVPGIIGGTRRLHYTRADMALLLMLDPSQGRYVSSSCLCAWRLVISSSVLSTDANSFEISLPGQARPVRTDGRMDLPCCALACIVTSTGATAVLFPAAIPTYDSETAVVVVINDRS